MSRLATIIDEAFGMQPVMSEEDSLTFLEKNLYDDRVRLEVARASVKHWTGEVDKLRAENERLSVQYKEACLGRDFKWEEAKQAKASIAELEQENERLRGETATLEHDLAKADARIAELEQELAAVKAQIVSVADSIEANARAHECMGADCATCYPNGRGGELRAIAEKGA